MSRRVVLATPTTLLALLRTVALTWQQDAVAGNARELFEVGRELYERLGTLGGTPPPSGARCTAPWRTTTASWARWSGASSCPPAASASWTWPTRRCPLVPLEDAVRPLTAPELLDEQVVPLRVRRE